MGPPPPPLAGAPNHATDEVEETEGTVARLQSIMNLLTLESTAVDSQQHVHGVEKKVRHEMTTHLPASDCLFNVCVKSFRNSEPGDGKDQLDMHFAHVAAHLKLKGDVLSVTDATSMTELLGAGGSLRETQLGVICYARAKNSIRTPSCPTSRTRRLADSARL